jgi:hypothetical protein
MPESRGTRFLVAGTPVVSYDHGNTAKAKRER